MNVDLKTPTTTNGEIKVSSWQLGMEEEKVSFGDSDLENFTKSAKLEIYKMSSNNLKIGLYNDASKIKVQNAVNHTFTTTNCAEDEIYILVIGPDGKPVKQAENETALGIWFDEEEDCVKINVAAQNEEDNLMLESLAEGKYTVRVTRIKSVTSIVNKVVLNTSFIVEDNTKEVTFRSLKNVKTSTSVASKDDVDSVRKIVAELFTFNLDGKEWTTLTEEMILNVTFKYVGNNNYIVVQSIEFAVPYGDAENSQMSYKKVVKNINKSIRTGVSD